MKKHLSFSLRGDFPLGGDNRRIDNSYRARHALESLNKRKTNPSGVYAGCAN